MARSVPDLLWTIGSGHVPYTGTQNITFTATPPFGAWGSMSAIVGVSETTTGSATIYSPAITIRPDKSFYTNSVKYYLCQSGPESAAAKSTWSTTIYPPDFSSSTASPDAKTKNHFYVGVSFPNRAPAGVFKWHIDVTGTYSDTDRTEANYYETYSYVYASRARSGGLTTWQKKTGHPVFVGVDGSSWQYEPFGYDTGSQSTTEKTSQVISHPYEVLGGASRTELPDY